jgi:hypothetical protein
MLFGRSWLRCLFAFRTQTRSDVNPVTVPEEGAGLLQWLSLSVMIFHAGVNRKALFPRTTPA